MKKGARNARGSTSPLNISHKKTKNLATTPQSSPSQSDARTQARSPLQKTLNVSQKFGISCTGRLQSERPVGTAEYRLEGDDASLGQRTTLLLHPFRLSHPRWGTETWLLTSAWAGKISNTGDPHWRHGKDLKNFFLRLFLGMFPSDELFWPFVECLECFEFSQTVKIIPVPWAMCV